LIHHLFFLTWSHEQPHADMNALIQKFVRIGYHPDDPEDEKLKKASLLVVSGPFVIAGIAWGIIYFSNGLLLPGAIPFTYGILSLLSIISFGITKQYVFFRNSQLILILILPFALQISLGGFVPSSAVMYWAIIAPAGAMFFDRISRSVYWFAAYILLVIVAYFINDLIPNYINWELSDDFINGLFLLNIIGVSCIVFGILFYFVSTITQLNQEIEKKSKVLEVQSEELKKMDKVKSRFFANISHEFRTPLTLILGLAKKQANNPSTPPASQDTQTTIRNANRLLELINQLLDLSKLESGELKLRASQGDFLRFVKNATAQFESMAVDEGIRLTFNGRGVEAAITDQPIEMFFDRERMYKVLNNLLSNAIKFTPAGEQIAVEVEQVESLNGSTAIVSMKIINTGITIPQEKLPYLFDRFFQVDASSNRQYEGTGIGLALVKELVELHQGQVHVTSKMNKTCFTIELPLSHDHLSADMIVEEPDQSEFESLLPSEPPLEDNISTPEPSEISSGSKPEVLIVEDNSDLRNFITGIIEQDYTVRQAVDGVDGFAKAQEAIPDLIISDVMMPRMNGFDLCKKLKTDDKTNHIPVILLTAKGARENKLEGLEKGADDYLIKPFDEAELKLRIKNLFVLRERMQAKFQGEMVLKPKTVNISSVHQKFLESLKEVIEENIDNESFGVEDLGRAIGMSRSQLHRKLKAITDQSATTHIRNYRLHRASELLTQNAGNITEIAFQVGFNSQTYFSSSFQELFGCSPSEYKTRQH